MENLQTPILLDGAIQNTHFFNGRILTAEALQEEQHANRLQRQKLGQAIGSGVAHGFEVRLIDEQSLTPSTRVTISPGLAINRNGQTLALPKEIDLSLTRDASASAPSADLFKDCDILDTNTLTGTGPYILVVCPASGYSSEQVPTVRLQDQGIASGCGNKYAVEGVKFRLISLDVLNDEILASAFPEALQSFIKLRFSVHF